MLHFADFEEKDLKSVFDTIWEGQRLDVDVEQVDALLIQIEERMRCSIQNNLINASILEGLKMKLEVMQKLYYPSKHAIRKVRQRFIEYLLVISVEVV